MANIDEVLTKYHCLKSVRLQSFSGPYFPAFRLDTGIFSPNAGGKIRIRKTLNTEIFHPVFISRGVIELILQESVF